MLAALDIDASTPEAAAARSGAPSSLSVDPDAAALHGDSGAPDRLSVGPCAAWRARSSVWIELETGETRDELRQLENWTPPREIDGGWVGEASFEIPADLPLGYHTLQARQRRAAILDAVDHYPGLAGLPGADGPSVAAWGLATQLYSVRSQQSWGIGDLTDLEDLAVWSAAEHQADFVLINPLHAAEPVPPMEPSPYLPSSRRFANPLYLRLERIPEYAMATAAQRDEDRQDQDSALDELGQSSRIDRDRAWNAKRKALKIIYSIPRTPGREASLRGIPPPGGTRPGELRHLGGALRATRPDFQDWPAELQHPASPAVADFAAATCRQDRLPLLAAVADGGAAGRHPAGGRAGRAWRSE